jgi:hypothetical protein
MENNLTPHRPGSKPSGQELDKNLHKIHFKDKKRIANLLNGYL